MPTSSVRRPTASLNGSWRYVRCSAGLYAVSAHLYKLVVYVRERVKRVVCWGARCACIRSWGARCACIRSWGARCACIRKK